MKKRPLWERSLEAGTPINQCPYLVTNPELYPAIPAVAVVPPKSIVAIKVPPNNTSPDKVNAIALPPLAPSVPYPKTSLQRSLGGVFPLIVNAAQKPFG